MAREKRYGGTRPRRTTTSYTFTEKKESPKMKFGTGLNPECLRCGYLNPEDSAGNKNGFYKCYAGDCPAMKKKADKKKNNRWERKRRINLDPVIDPKSGAYGDV